MCKTCWLCRVLLLGSLFAITQEADAQFDDLIRRVPENANAIALVNAERIFASEIAKRENWQSDHDKRFAAGQSSIPPHATQMVWLKAYRRSGVQLGPACRVAVVCEHSFQIKLVDDEH